MTTPHPLATRLAQAEADLSTAEAAHKTATDNLADVGEKIAEVDASINTLSTRRLTGHGTEESTAELVALQADRVTLHAMRDEALAEVKALDPTDARAIADQARFDWDQHCATEHLAALVAKAKEIDALLCRCITEIREAGKPLRRVHLSESWRPSRELHLTIGREFPPA